MKNTGNRLGHSLRFWLGVVISFYICLLAFSYLFNIVYPIPDFHDRSEIGCYWTNALFVYAECQGFFGANIIEFVRSFFILSIQLSPIIISYPLIGIIYLLIFVGGLVLFLWLGERAFLWSKIAWLRRISRD